MRLLSTLKSVHWLTRLKLNLKQTGITQFCVSALSSSLGFMVNLENLEINLSGNSIGSSGSYHLSLCFANLSKLARLSLDLNKNGITGDGL
jgi:hypothetical protein